MDVPGELASLHEATRVICPRSLHCLWEVARCGLRWCRPRPGVRMPSVPDRAGDRKGEMGLRLHGIQTAF